MFPPEDPERGLAMMLPGRAAGGVFVGRESEMRQLDEALTAAAGGRGGLVLLAGEPGIGKTRMAAELAARAGARGAAACWGRCWEGEGPPAFWPWVQLVRSYARDRQGAELRADLGRAGAYIARVIPDIGAQLSEAELAPAGGVLDERPEQQRFGFFDGLTCFLKAAARRQPIVLILDDLQWADASSLLLLQFLAHEVADAALLVLGAYRDTGLTAAHPLHGALGALSREGHCQRLTLAGLTAGEIARYVELETGCRPAAKLVAALAAHTEGNPFFLREVVQLLRGEGRLERNGDDAPCNLVLPASVQQAITSLIAPLPASCRHVLGLAAVIGREFDLRVLHAVAGRHEGADEEPLDSMLLALEPARAARLILAVPGTAGRCTFVHALIRETLHAELPEPRRAPLHRRVADVLERIYADDIEAHTGELAYHFAAAGLEPVGQAKALAYSRTAGDRALQRFAYEEAVRSYEGALDVLAAQPSPDRATRCELLLALAEAEMRAGNPAGARVRSLEAAALARGLGLREHFARAALGVGWWFRVGVVDEERIRLLNEALGERGADDSRLTANLMARLATELYWIPDTYERRARLSAEAVAMARRLDDPAALAFALNARLFALWVPGDAKLRLHASRELLQLADSIGDAELALQSRQWLMTDLLNLGDLAAVDRELGAQARQAEAVRRPLYLWQVAVWRALRAVIDGRLDDVEALAAEALERGLRAEPDNAQAAYSSLMFWLRREQGRLGEFVAILSGYAAQHTQLSADYRMGLALTYAELDRAAEAGREFAQLAALGFTSFPRHNAWLPTMAGAAEVCAYLRDAGSALVLYDLLLPFARRNIVVGTVSGFFGCASRYLGLLAAVLRRWPEAEQHFRDALDMHERMRAWPLHARTQRDLAAMLVARDAPGDRVQALDLLDRAVDTARQIGMQSLLDKALALRAAAAPAADAPLCAAATAGESRAVPTAGGVFRRDGEYWTLSFEGHVVRLKDAKGLHYIAYLLRHPGHEFHARELMALIGDPAAVVAQPSPAACAGDLRTRADLGNAGALLDGRARAEYKQRIGDLRQELEEAERCNDPGRVDRARGEIELITQQLTAGVGLSGRDRVAASGAERARLAVTKRIKAALAKIQQADPVLARHLVAAITTGYLCCYAPTVDALTSWGI